jgi:hypothetical protein
MLGMMLLVSTVQAVVVVTIRLHHQQSNNFPQEQHQNAQWSRLRSDMCCLTAFPFGGPGKWVQCTHSGGKGAVSTAWIVAVYLSPPQQLRRPQKCSRNSLSWTHPVKGEIFVTVVMAPFLHLPYQMCRTAPHRCQNPKPFHVFGSGTVDEPV